MICLPGFNTSPYLIYINWEKSILQQVYLSWPKFQPRCCPHLGPSPKFQLVKVILDFYISSIFFQAGEWRFWPRFSPSPRSLSIQTHGPYLNLYCPQFHLVMVSNLNFELALDSNFDFTRPKKRHVATEDSGGAFAEKEGHQELPFCLNYW